ncbi:hypothetical protein BRADI_3g32715v3 [Brachypodium distachyon]|uniref:Uncharacterized protein n=1 Tax=Brachypodium distachyon TaxID=15368 RepID=A0A0Q3HW59_BRADI|nr:hypothetical protein BRADI_3g32715v3 [Brachypodium distachyon]
MIPSPAACLFSPAWMASLCEIQLPEGRLQQRTCVLPSGRVKKILVVVDLSPHPHTIFRSTWTNLCVEKFFWARILSKKHNQGYRKFREAEKTGELMYSYLHVETTKFQLIRIFF